MASACGHQYNLPSAEDSLALGGLDCISTSIQLGLGRCAQITGAKRNFRL